VTTDWALDWDAWRRDHAEMSFAEQQAFYERVAEEYPRQQSFDLEATQRAFNTIGELGLTVVELGGWDGALAEFMLARGGIVSWVNYDIVAVPQVCEHPAYRLEVLDGYLWERPVLVADVFVATHTIEHLTAEQLARLLDMLWVSYLYLEAPLPSAGPVNWTGYSGSHILELNWEQVGEMLRGRGYEPVVENLWCRGL
jgi:hypothetical protein